MDPTSVRDRLQRLPPWAGDIALVVLQGAITLMAIASAVPETGPPAGREADAFAYALGACSALVLLLRRRWPVGVLVASALIVLGYHALNYPPIGPVMAVAVAAYAAAAAGYLLGAIVVAILLVGGGVIYRSVFEQTSLLELVRTGVILEAEAFAAIIFFGDAMASRRALTIEMKEKLQRAEEEREREAQRRVARERMRIARELHDVMAHTVAAIAVQAGVAADVLDEAPEQARGALDTIRAASREAMTELKATVGVLRDENGHSRSPAPRLGQLDALVDMVRGAGLMVGVAIDGEKRALPAAVELTAYRIVQESLTNVLRHAGAESVSVGIHYGGRDVRIEIVDDGRGPADGSASSTGHGITGMKERSQALGGKLDTGPAPGGGYRVAAVLPTHGA